tara:strand:+ start:1002 stop:2138 length:1137 start_codon:yes stop_codon:yes gene_type:complete
MNISIDKETNLYQSIEYLFKRKYILIFISLISFVISYVALSQMIENKEYEIAIDIYEIGLDESIKYKSFNEYKQYDPMDNIIYRIEEDYRIDSNFLIKLFDKTYNKLSNNNIFLSELFDEIKNKEYQNSKEFFVEDIKENISYKKMLDNPMQYGQLILKSNNIEMGEEILISFVEKMDIETNKYLKKIFEGYMKQNLEIKKNKSNHFKNLISVEKTIYNEIKKQEIAYLMEQIQIAKKLNIKRSIDGEVTLLDDKMLNVNLNKNYDYSLGYETLESIKQAVEERNSSQDDFYNKDLTSLERSRLIILDNIDILEKNLRNTPIYNGEFKSIEFMEDKILINKISLDFILSIVISFCVFLMTCIVLIIRLYFMSSSETNS